MTRTPAAHRLATKTARQERAHRRAMYRDPYFRVPMRWVTGVDPNLSDQEFADLMAGWQNAPLMVLPEPWFSPPRIRPLGSMPAEYQRVVDRIEKPSEFRAKEAP